MRIGNHRRDGVRAGLAAAAIAATVLAGTAACTGSSTSGTASAGTSASAAVPSSPTAAGTVSVPAVSASATGAPTPARTGSGGNATGASGIPSCGNADVTVSLGRAGAAMNHASQPLVFKNVGAHACTLHGYPGAAVVGGGRTLINATRELNGYVGDMQQLSSAPVVTLQPGQSATGMLEWEGSAGEKCYPDGSGSLVVTSPNTTKSVSLLPVTVGTKGICAGFEVHPVVPGIIS
jgi:hypothetical protein